MCIQLSYFVESTELQSILSKLILKFVPIFEGKVILKRKFKQIFIALGEISDHKKFWSHSDNIRTDIYISCINIYVCVVSMRIISYCVTCDDVAFFTNQDHIWYIQINAVYLLMYRNFTFKALISHQELISVKYYAIIYTGWLSNKNIFFLFHKGINGRS